MAKLRLDLALVERGLFDTRARARDAILRGTVTVNGLLAAKPAMTVHDGARIAVSDPASGYVSRAALKLIHGLDHFGLSPEGLSCLDIGASTGGFTQVLLERGAAHVTAIDVGHGQLHQMVQGDPRVTAIEGLNARDLAPEHLAKPPDFIACDVSFISLKLALATALDLASPGARLVALIKPQFEAGRDALDGRGIVRGELIHDSVCAGISRWITGRGWDVLGLAPSPISGGDGNREFLMAARRSTLTERLP